MDLKDVFSLLEDNARRTWNPLGVREIKCGEWAKGLGLSERGEYLLYTGCLYQMVPDIEAFSGILKRLESAGKTVFSVSLKITRALNKLGLDLTGIYTTIAVSGERRERFSAVLRNIVRALRSVGIEPAYMREEPYNGVLYHDLGLDHLFEPHARRLAEKIRRTGAKTVITVDPHTTYALRHLLPEVVEGWDVEVVHYLEVLAERGYQPTKRGGSAVIHDPCYLARWNGVLDQPRELLDRAGIRLKEPEFSRRFTGCCGGPIESLLPTIASEVARKRVKELVEAGSKRLVVACPICLVNLSREAREFGAEVLDISELLG